VFKRIAPATMRRAIIAIVAATARFPFKTMPFRTGSGYIRLPVLRLRFRSPGSSDGSTIQAGGGAQPTGTYLIERCVLPIGMSL
jgi:hypothetical protein